jgi:hypothetical protein
MSAYDKSTDPGAWHISPLKGRSEPLTGRSPPSALNRASGRRTKRRISTQKATEHAEGNREKISNEALATTQCRVCRRVGISAADRTRLTSGQPRPTTTALPAGHVLELQYGCMRIPATSGRVRRSVVAGLGPGYRRCRPRPRPRYPSSWPSRYRGSRGTEYRGSRGTGYRASWTKGRWARRWAWRWATLGHRTKAGPTWETTHPTVPHR